MAFDWEEYLVLARFLRGETTCPSRSAKERSAISRAYYAALKTTYNYVSAKHPTADIGVAGGVHTRLPTWLQNQPNQDYQQVGTLLDRLRKKRHAADYNDEDPRRIGDEARNAILDSDQIIGIVRSLSPV